MHPQMAIRAACAAGLVLLVAAPCGAQMSAEEELATLRAPAGMELALFAAEPLVRNPSAIDVDTHGRVWVAEIQWYRSRAKDPPADKIKVLEDTDGDGRADKATVFAEGIFAPMSVCVAGDKVYVATSPDLWVYEDKNGDLKADGAPKKLLTGFGGRNHDHGAHSLVLGPDHKWWMAHGDEGFDLTGKDGSRAQSRWGAVLRGELDGSQLEVVAQNFRNTYEPCISSFGEAFLSDNDNDGNESVRICWIMEGGDYGWFGHPPFERKLLDAKVPPGVPFREAWHFRGYQPGLIPGTLVTGFGSPCGICYYEGDAFGVALKNMPLHCDSGPREVRKYPHTAHGFGMSAESAVIMSTQGDPYFRPDDICAAPDGSLYISDWYDGGVGGHAYNDPDRGRIFLLRPEGKKLTRIGKPGPFASIEEAIEGLRNPNLATQYLARVRLLAAGEQAVPALKSLMASDDENYSARALWVLDRIGGDGRFPVVAQLESDRESFRALAVRILRRHGERFTEQILALADDPSPQVRREVLLGMPKFPPGSADKAWVTMAAAFNGQDRYELEALHIATGERKAELFQQWRKVSPIRVEQLPLVQLFDAEGASAMLVSALSHADVSGEQRQALFNQLAINPSEAAGEAVMRLALDDRTDDALRARAIGLLGANLSDSWQGLAGRDELLAGLRRMLSQRPWQAATQDLIVRNQVRSLGGDILKLIADPSQPLEIRLAAIRGAAELRAEGAEAALQAVLATSEERLHEEAMQALVALQDWGVFRGILLGQEHSLQERAALTDRLMASTAGAYFMLRMLDEEELPQDLHAQVLKLAITHPDSNVRVLFEKYIPEDQRPERLGDAVKPKEILALTGDAGRGERIFFESSAAQCKNCHTVRGKGANVGPDLSQIGRKYERGALLETILQPSKAIAPEYFPYILETEGGQVYIGYLAEKGEDTVVIKDAAAGTIRVPSKEISALERREQSLMPELILRDVTAQDAADLLSYLMTLSDASPAP